METNEAHRAETLLVCVQRCAGITYRFLECDINWVSPGVVVLVWERRGRKCVRVTDEFLERLGTSGEHTTKER